MNEKTRGLKESFAMFQQLLTLADNAIEAFNVFLRQIEDLKILEQLEQLIQVRKREISGQNSLDTK